MQHILEQCRQLAGTLELEIKKYQEKFRQLKQKEDDLNKLNEGLKSKEEELKRREKNIVPSEKLIEREIECDKKFDEAKALIADVQTRSKNNTIAMEKQRNELRHMANALRKKDEEISAKIKRFEEEKRNWKSKLIEKIKEEESGN